MTTQVGRNAEGRLRVTGIQASLRLGVTADRLVHADRVLAQFEAFCTVTQSLVQAISVDVQVHDAAGARLT